MNKIAIIDTIVDTSRIQNKNIEIYDLYFNSNREDMCTINHGTLCAMVLEECASDYELINIRIFEEDEMKTYCDIDKLCEALQMCIALDINVVSLSAGTMRLSDSKRLFELTKNLSKQAVIISSLSNGKFVTIPASYPHIIGVRADVAGVLHTGEIAVQKENQLGFDVYANCDFASLHEYGHTKSNSMAVPVVAAFANNLINQGHSVAEVYDIIRNQKPYPLQESYADIALLKDREVPIVFVENTEDRNIYTYMDLLNERYEVEASVLMQKPQGYDIRTKQIEDIGFDLAFMKRYYKTDIIFVCGDKNLLNQVQDQVEIDIEITFANNDIALFEYDDITEEVEAPNIIDRLYHLLDA